MNAGPFDLPFDRLPAELPIFPLTGALLLPRGRLPLNIFEPRYLAMVENALGAGRLIGMVQPRVPGEAGLSVDDGTAIYPVGCAGRITSFQETEDGRFVLSLSGVCRFAIAAELPGRHGYRQVRADWSRWAADMAGDGVEDGIDRTSLLAALRGYFTRHGIDTDWAAVERTPTDRLVTMVAMGCPFAPQEKQALLEAPDLAARTALLRDLAEAGRHESAAGGSSTVN
ncbi:MAG: peptidase S16 [Alphaproteobacteria bacterium]|nr:peptidase S16 [Alphaproteobacteria bacterium]